VRHLNEEDLVINIEYETSLEKKITSTVTCAFREYKTVDELVSEINEVIFKECKNIKIKFFPLKNRVFIICHRACLKISKRLACILGYGKTCEFENEEFLSQYHPDLRNDMHYLYIYTNIVEKQIVGNTLVPLLRYVSLTGEYGDTVTNSVRPYYLKPAMKEIDTVAITVCNEFGEEIQFNHGVFTVTLHFRQKRTKVRVNELDYILCKINIQWNL